MPTKSPVQRALERGGRRLSIAAVLVLALAGSATGQARRGSAQVPVTGGILELQLRDGTRARGELIEAGEGTVLLWADDGLRDFSLSNVRVAQHMRHGFGAGKAVAWVALGGLVSGVGLTAACVQVEDVECGGVFPGVLISWAIVGGLAAGSIAASQKRRLGLSPAELRPLARFPQGAPPGYRERIGRSTPPGR